MSAADNGGLTDALSVDLNNRYADINIKPRLVNKSNCTNLPSGLSWGLREVFWSAQNYLVVKITGEGDDGRSGIWTIQYSGNNWGAWQRDITTESISSQSVNYANSAGTANFATHDSDGRSIHQDMQALIYGELASGDEQQVYGGSKAKMWTDNEGGNLHLSSPNGSMGLEIDCYNNSGARLFVTNDGNSGIFLGIDGNVTIQNGDILLRDGGRLNADGNIYFNVSGYNSYLSDILSGLKDADNYRIISGKSGSGYTKIDHINKMNNDNRVIFSCNNGAQSYTVSVTGYSDERVKSNIKDSNINAIESINKIKLHQFDFVDDSYGKHSNCGYIAQELIDIFPLAVIDIPQNKELTGYNSLYQVDDSRLIPYLVKAIQELSAEIEELKKK